MKHVPSTANRFGQIKVYCSCGVSSPWLRAPAEVKAWIEKHREGGK